VLLDAVEAPCNFNALVPVFILTRHVGKCFNR
jgi:hypothetical protein